MSALSSAQRIRGRREAPPSSPGAGSVGCDAGASGGNASRAFPTVLGKARDVSWSGNQRSASSTKAPAPTAVELSARAASIRSAGRWAVPIGTDTMKVLPCPYVLSARTEPPWSLTSSWTSARPMPVPSCVRPRDPSTRWNRSKMRGSSASGMPVPVSRTASSAAPSPGLSWTAISPSRVNLKALETRLRTTFSHMSRST